MAEAFLRKAEQAGKLGELTKSGWLIDDLDDGGLQFDNALAGVAVLHLYERTKNPDYLTAVQRSANWVNAPQNCHQLELQQLQRLFAGRNLSRYGRLKVL